MNNNKVTIKVKEHNGNYYIEYREDSDLTNYGIITQCLPAIGVAINEDKDKFIKDINNKFNLKIDEDTHINYFNKKEIANKIANWIRSKYILNKMTNKGR
jgi:hypothetical protein